MNQWITAFCILSVTSCGAYDGADHSEGGEVNSDVQQPLSGVRCREPLPRGTGGHC